MSSTRYDLRPSVTARFGSIKLSRISIPTDHLEGTQIGIERNAVKGRGVTKRRAPLEPGLFYHSTYSKGTGMKCTACKAKGSRCGIAAVARAPLQSIMSGGVSKTDRYLKENPRQNQNKTVDHTSYIRHVQYS